MFEVTARRKFRAIHALSNYRGGDEDPHEHEWSLEVTLAADDLDDAGCAVDFAEVDQAIDRALAPIAGRVLNGLFADKSPSAENVARYLYKALSETLAKDGRRITRVTVWEDANHSAAYTE